MVRRSLLFITLLLFVSLVAAQTPPPFRVVGYYSINAASAKVNRSILKQLTHVNLWFLNPDSAGNFTGDLSALERFIRIAHRKNVKVLFSIGGGTKQPQYHSLLLDANRPMFIRNLVGEVRKYNVDGIDVDLEGSNIDENYEKFVAELATAMRAEHKLITAAIAVYYKDQLTDNAIAQYDFVNVMSYDRTGPWRPEQPGPHATYAHAVDDLQYFGSVRKIPKERMTLGVPFYGYGYGPEINSPAISKSYREIVALFPGSELVDQWTMPDGKILYYNGIPTMEQKTMLAKEKASGVMIWQVLGDAKGFRSLLKAINRSKAISKN